MMRMTAGLTVTGLIGYLVLEALKILLAPAALWLLAVTMVVVKVAAVGLGLIVLLALSVFVYKRFTRDPDEMAA